MIEKRKRKREMRRVRDDGFTLVFSSRSSSRVDLVVFLAEDKQKQKWKEIGKRGERKEAGGNEGTGTERGNRENTKEIKETEKQRRIGIDFGH